MNVVGVIVATAAKCTTVTNAADATTMGADANGRGKVTVAVPEAALASETLTVPT